MPRKRLPQVPIERLFYYRIKRLHETTVIILDNLMILLIWE